MTGAGQGPRPFRSGFVAVVGRPNVGKSTLVNHLVGRKVAIVSDVPQTTRCRIQGIVNLPDAQIALVDTPGVHRPLHEMNRWMVADSARSIQDVDLVVFMIEAVDSRGQPARDLGPGDRFVLSMLPRDAAPVVLAVNKIDLVRKAALLPLVDRVKESFPYAEVLLISALESQNTHDVASRLAIHLPEGPPLFPAEHVTDPPERFMASELIREKLLHHTRQEIPHETCVMIEGYEETPAGLVRIQATILVDKESQKKIVIGRQGAMLKTVGTEARADLEQLLGAKVFLDLWVKVREGWRDNESILRRLGLGPPA